MRRQRQGSTGLDGTDHRGCGRHSLRSTSADGTTRAVSSGVAEIVSDLLHSGADVNAVNEKGQTAL